MCVHLGVGQDLLLFLSTILPPPPSLASDQIAAESKGGKTNLFFTLPVGVCVCVCARADPRDKHNDRARATRS